MKLERKLEVGQLVSVRGTIFAVEPKDADYVVTVNFSTSPDGYDATDIPFHISIRLSHNEVVFNTKENNTWGAEEKAKLKWKPGSPIDLRVRLNENHFEVLADGVSYATYKYRVAIQQITYLFVDGPLSLEGVNWGGKHYPVPYETGLKGGFRTGQKLYVSGVVDAKPTRFHINLKTGDGDTALHFNPRFNDNEVVRNTQAAGEWQVEEKDGQFPFKKNTVFDIVFQYHPDQFQVFVNNNSFCTYEHRVKNPIEALEVDGDLELLSVQLV